MFLTVSKISSEWRPVEEAAQMSVGVQCSVAPTRGQEWEQVWSRVWWSAVALPACFLILDLYKSWMEGTSAAVIFCAVLTFRCSLFSPCVVADPKFGCAESRLDYCRVEMDGQLLSWFRKFNLEPASRWKLPALILNELWFEKPRIVLTESAVCSLSPARVEVFSVCLCLQHRPKRQQATTRHQLCQVPL